MKDSAAPDVAHPADPADCGDVPLAPEATWASEEPGRGELFRWLEDRLKHERQSLAQQHAVILDELRFMVSDCRGDPGGYVPKAEDPAPAPLQGLADQEPSASVSFAPAEIAVELKEISEAESPREESKKSKTKLNKRAATLSQSLTVERSTMPFWYPDRIIRTYTFEIFYAILIFLQAIAMAVEAQYAGFAWGHRLEYAGYDQPADEVWPNMPDVLQAAEVFFGILFCLEVVLKLIGLRKTYFNDPWNWFDFFLVAMWLADMVIAFPVNSSQLRLIRLARLLRLVRLVRVVRGFDSLIVMTTALQESANGLFWVAVIMLVVELLFALLLNQVLVTMVSQTKYSKQEEKVLFEYFGTFPRAMLTMFQVTLGTWVPVARILQEVVGPVMNTFTILHKVTIGFACIGVINGVFMQETLRVAQSDDVIMMRDVARRDRLHADKMKAFFDLADQSGDTMISRKKWKDVMASPSTKQWFAAQGLSIRDPDEVFTLLDADRSETMTIDELIVGVAKLHGPARSLDLAILAESQRKLQLITEELVGRLGSEDMATTRRSDEIFPL